MDRLIRLRSALIGLGFALEDYDPHELASTVWRWAEQLDAVIARRRNEEAPVVSG